MRIYCLLNRRPATARPKKDPSLVEKICYSVLRTYQVKHVQQKEIETPVGLQQTGTH